MAFKDPDAAAPTTNTFVDPDRGAKSGAFVDPDTQQPSSRTSRILGTLASASDLFLGIPGFISKALTEQEASVEQTVGDILRVPGYQVDTSAEQQQFLKDLLESQGGINLRTGMSTERAMQDYYTATLNHVSGQAREIAAERTPMWMQAPAMTAMKAAGAEQAYAESAPARAMNWFGERMESGAAEAERRGIMPRYTMLNFADAVMAYGGAKLPGWVKARMVAPDAAEVVSRLRTQVPTGERVPRDVSSAELQAVMDKLAKERHPTTPVDKPEIRAAKRQKVHLAEGEYIAGPHEGDLGFMDSPDWKAAHEAHVQRVSEQRPERAPPGELPPIEAYEGAIPAPREAVAEISDILSDPELSSPDKVVAETAKDMATERIADAVRPNMAVKPASAGKYLERAGVTSVSRETATQLREAGFPVDNSAPDGGVSEVESMLRDEQNGYPHYSMAEQSRPAALDWIRQTAVRADIAANRLIGGAPEETISARAGRLKEESPTWRTVAGALDAVVPGHTERAMEATLARQRGFIKGGEEGKISPRLVIPLGITAGGAVIGSALDPNEPIYGALKGAFSAFAIANIGRAAIDYGVGTKAGQVWSAIRPSIDPARATAARVIFGRTANVKVELRKVGALQRAMMKAIPPHRLEEITHLAQAGRLDALTPAERYYVAKTQQWYDRIGTMAQEAGVIQRLITKNYVPQAWDLKDAATKKFFDEGGFDRMATAAFTQHGLRRGINSYMEGLSIGLKPKTLNYAELLGMYANSVVRATHNAEALTILKTTDLGGGLHPLEPIGADMPRDYVRNHGIEGLEGYAVHPESVKALQRAFDSYEQGVIERALLSTAFTFKRVAVSYSGFHPAALTLAYMGAGGNPLGFALGAAARGLETLTGDRVSIPYRSAVDRALDAYRSTSPEAAEVMDWGIRNGLELGTPIEDIVGKKAFDRMTEIMDTAIGGDIHGLRPLERMDKEVHNFIWNYTQTGMKLDIFQKEFSRAVVDPKNMGKDLNEIAADVASYTNNLFGTLNWERIIERMRSRAGRAIAGAAYSKKGLNIAQIVSFAPDWLVSTMRSWTQAIPGLAENARVARLHRMYLMRSMLYTLAISDAVNYSLSGHHVWQNDFRSKRQKQKEGEQTWAEQLHDMTYIDMGDGRRMQSNKHLFEFIHAITDPGKFIANKASTVVTDPLNTLSNRQWASFDYAPPITTAKDPAQRALDWAKWMAEHHAPISVQQMAKGNLGGTFGLPITGLTHEQRQEIRQKEKEKR